ncbi:helix-turn-helix domain-containing protein [Nocardia brasiliensis]|uniref:helix-turn-helix domain-containing protein n=1 Tax=Nocardia brasiliensis TaxID=37326 RepID=UPI0033F97F2B
MTTLWKSTDVPAAQRADAVREAVGTRVVRVDIDLPEDPRKVQVDLSLSHAGPVQILTVNSMATTVTRSPRLARAENEPQLFLTLQGTGASAMTQHGREAKLSTGEFAVYTTSSPYTLAFDQGLDAHFFRFPLAELAMPESAIHEVSARVLGASNSVGQLTAGYLQRIAESTDLRSRAIADTLAQPTIDLVRAALLSSMADPRVGKESMQTTLELRLLEYLRTHLGDHSLTAAKIAAAHHISVRHLYAVLERAEISLGGWLRTQRLEACRRELAHPNARHRTIASIAYQWGFADATHFSRAFRSAYGLTPSDWRKAKAKPPNNIR